MFKILGGMNWSGGNIQSRVNFVMLIFVKCGKYVFCKEYFPSALYKYFLLH